MSVILLLIVASLSLALAFLAGFIWAVRSGQFEDTYTPSLRLLTDEVSAETKRSVNDSVHLGQSAQVIVPGERSGQKLAANPPRTFVCGLLRTGMSVRRRLSPTVLKTKRQNTSEKV